MTHSFTYKNRLLVGACISAFALVVNSSNAEPSLQGIQSDFPIAFGEENIVVSAKDVGVSANWVFAEDVDGDGDLDLLGTFRDNNKVAWYENRGGDNPIFKQHVISTNAKGAQSVYAADLDGDGDIDVLSASKNDDKISWYENDGGNPPKFEEHVIATDEIRARAVFAIDLDKDGDIDVLSASQIEDRISWYENDGDSEPSFSQHTVTNNHDGAWDVFAIDIDGDDDIDVLSAYSNDNKVVWSENRGEVFPSFEDHVITNDANEAISVFAEDLNGDGNVDILSASLGDALAWYENDGENQPTFSEHFITGVEGAAASVAAADIDNDGDIDVLSSSTGDDRLRWYENDGSALPNFTSHTIAMETDARKVFPADINNDGAIDILTASFNESKISWYENDTLSDPSFTEHVMPKGADGPNQVYAADINGDGHVDLLSASDNDNQVAWYQNTGDSPPEFIQRVLTTSADSALSVFAEDMDNDGDLDILSASSSDGSVRWFENGGGESPNFTEHIIEDRFEGVRSVHAVDLNNDGHKDVISAAVFVNAVAMHISDGGQPPEFLSLFFTAEVGGASSVHGADVDGDGDNDILAGGLFNDDLFWFENTTPSDRSGTSPTFNIRFITRNAPGVSFIHTDDLDRDGDLDVLASGGNSIIWYDNNGKPEPGFTKRTITVNTDFAQSVYSLDVDGDGDIDVMSASHDDNKIAVFENIGGSPPQFEEHVLNDQALRATTVFAADLDNDGDPEVIGGSFADDTISWHENQTAFNLNKLIRYLLGEVVELSATEEIRQDANNDGLINIADVIAFLSQ